MFDGIVTERGLPLPGLRAIESTVSILRKRSFTELTAQCLFGNSAQIRFAPHPFCLTNNFISSLVVASKHCLLFSTDDVIVLPTKNGSVHFRIRSISEFFSEINFLFLKDT